MGSYEKIGSPGVSGLSEQLASTRKSLRWTTAQLQTPKVRKTLLLLVAGIAATGALWLAFLRSSYYSAPLPSHPAAASTEERMEIWKALTHGHVENTPHARLELPTTRVLNHAPGFTLFENLYWKDWTFYILTDQPWSVPAIKAITEPKHDYGVLGGQKSRFELLSLRENGVFYGVDEDAGIGQTMSVEAATENFGHAEEIRSHMLLNNDVKFTAHYYHWVGEMFTGAWRLYQNYAWRLGRQDMPDFDSISFLHAFWKSEAPGLLWKSRAKYWNDGPGANEFFMKTFFPNVAIETQADWEERAASGKMYRLSSVLYTDRNAGWTGAYSNSKPMGDVLRLFVPPDWLLRLRDRVLKDYAGPEVLTPRRPKILYTTRQNHWNNRHLAEDVHEALIKTLMEIQEDGLADVEVKQFSSSMSFTDQVAAFAGTEYLVGVHGNGLTHLIWMNPGANVFEIQPQQCSNNDYSPLAVAVGLTHHMVRGNEFCYPNECPLRGCTHATDYNINQSDFRFNPTVISDHIRRLIKEKESKRLSSA